MVPFWQELLYLENGSTFAGNIVSRECAISAGNIVSREGFHFGRYYSIYIRVPFWQVIFYLHKGSILAGIIVSREWFHFGRYYCF